MFELFNSVKKLTKLDDVTIDNFVFRLHYKATFILLVTGSILVTAKQYFGDPISCVVDKIPQKVMDTYCWIESTFTLPDLLDAVVGQQVPHPGIGLAPSSTVKYHKYYQWVCFFLFLQAICFYAPRYLWKSWERNRLKNLVENLSNPLIELAKRQQQQQQLIEYLKNNFNRQNFYAYRFFICELLNFFNALIQIFVVDAFLDNEFSTYGSKVLTFVNQEQEGRIDPMVRVFPKITKCTFKKYGPSGSIETHDGLCVLPLNIINEKIFVVLWFWLNFIAIISFLQLIYRTVILFSATCRLHIIRIYSRIIDYRIIFDIHSRCDIGDWFILLQLGKNIDPLTFKEIIVGFGEHLRSEDFERMNGMRAFRESKLMLNESNTKNGSDIEAVNSPKYD